MSDSLDLNTIGAISSMADTDKVTVMTSAGAKSITFANLRDALSHVKTSIGANPNDWVRIAKVTPPTNPFAGIITVHHHWASGVPIPLVCFVSGSGGNNKVFQAERMTRDSYFLNNQSSFTKLRFVQENNEVYIEVQFRNTGTSGTLHTSLSSAVNLTLIQASISTASETDIIKTVDLMVSAQSGGGITDCQIVSYNLSEILSQRGGPHERSNRLFSGLPQSSTPDVDCGPRTAHRLQRQRCGVGNIRRDTPNPESSKRSIQVWCGHHCEDHMVQKCLHLVQVHDSRLYRNLRTNRLGGSENLLEEDTLRNSDIVRREVVAA